MIFFRYSPTAKAGGLLSCRPCGTLKTGLFDGRILRCGYCDAGWDGRDPGFGEDAPDPWADWLATGQKPSHKYPQRRWEKE
jgi:hypothetical protein